MWLLLALRALGNFIGCNTGLYHVWTYWPTKEEAQIAAELSKKPVPYENFRGCRISACQRIEEKDQHGKWHHYLSV
jgi:hypothetical protein